MLRMPRRQATSPIRRLAREDGLTVVEVLVAAMIMIVGGLAVLQVVDAATRNNFRAERSQVVSNRLQDEVEKVKTLSYDELALTGLPADTSDTTDPRWRTQGDNYAVTQQGGSQQPLVYNGSALYGGGSVNGGAIDPAPVPFTSGDISGNVYRFVVWENDDSCSEAQCPGTQDLKRVIVAVGADTTTAGGAAQYQEVQSQIVDPEVQPVDNENPLPPGDDDSKPWTIFPTDTSCDNTTRQPITGDHLTHNTRGACSTGQTSGNNPGAPDLFSDAPLLDPDIESPIFDYATDVEPSVDPDKDKGLQLLPQSSAGCTSDALGAFSPPDAEVDRFQRIHRWLTPPIPSEDEVQLDGDGTLELWSQTVNSVSYPGKICLWLFKRQVNVLGQTTDTAFTDLSQGGAGYFTYSQSSWPTTWSELQITFDFPSDIVLQPGDRLGMALAIDPSGTGDGSQGLQFMYDEPSFDSRLELMTQSNLPSF
jgi:type II secretory pathway pseudopilin PulG